MGKKKRRKKKLNPLSREARKFKTDIRTTFTNCGFEHFLTRNTEINVADRKSDIDSLFVYNNILVVVEDTCTGKTRDLLDHLRQKHEYFEHLKKHQRELIETLKSTFTGFKKYYQNKPLCNPEDYKIVFLYCSKTTIEKTYKQRYNDIIHFLGYAELQYFLHLSRTIKKSARFELLKYFGVELSDIGYQSNRKDARKYKGILLPESPSGFPAGYKIVSFLVDPEFLLEQAYVLRTDSWQDTGCLYQRLLIKSKINSMREFLSTQRRVFINNIIATLPSDVEMRDEKGRVITDESLSNIQDVVIEIPRRFNALGIIDGQHRLYSYHEGNDKHERTIQHLRPKQHLLITGIVYPQDVSNDKKAKFEATLFLEINDKQKKVVGALKQEIERIITPYSPVALAKAVISVLGNEGPLCGELEIHFYDKKKIKTTSIVSYGLKHVVGIDNENSFFKIWRNSKKKDIRKNKTVLDDYVRYCSTQIKTFFEAFKQVIPDEMWTSDKKTSRVLTTTTINGLIFCIRKLIENRKIGDFEYYRDSLCKSDIKFDPGKFKYKSSHWKDLGEEIYRQCFGA
jgi:DGQHR domain-containing protein